MTSTITKIDQGILVTGNLTFDNIKGLLDLDTLMSNQVDSLNQANGSNKNDFVIDCHNVERIDSAGIALLLKWKKEILNKKGACRFEGLSKQVKSLVQAYRLESLIQA